MEQMIFALLGFGGAGLVFFGGNSMRSHTKPEQQPQQFISQVIELPEPYASIYRIGLHKGELTVRGLQQLTIPALTNAGKNRAEEIHKMLVRLHKYQWVELTPGNSFSSTRFVAIPNARGYPIEDKPTGF